VENTNIAVYGMCSDVVPINTGEYSESRFLNPFYVMYRAIFSIIQALMNKINAVCPHLLYFKESPLFHDSARSPLFNAFLTNLFFGKREIVCIFICLFPHKLG